MYTAVPKATVMSRTSTTPAARRPGERRPAAHGECVVGHPLLCGEFLEAGSTDERLVEDDGSVFVLTASGRALGRPVRWVLLALPYFQVGLRDSGKRTAAPQVRSAFRKG